MMYGISVCRSAAEASGTHWSCHCVDRIGLEQQVDTIRRLRLKSDARLTEEHARFKSLLDVELEKINMFHSEAVAFFTGKVHLLDHRFGLFRKVHESSRSSILHSLQYEILLCGKSLLNLEEFVLSNYADLQQVLKRLDDALGWRESDVHMRRIELGAFYTQSPPEHLCQKLEHIFSAAKAVQRARANLGEPHGFMSEWFNSQCDLWRECRRIGSLQDVGGISFVPRLDTALPAYATPKAPPSESPSKDRVEEWTTSILTVVFVLFLLIVLCKQWM